jgi:ATP-dependent helicase HrpB
MSPTKPNRALLLNNHIMHFETPLPIDDALPSLATALEASPNAVLVAPPGAGKTTRVPLALLDSPWRGDQRIIMLEPRRLAARGAAERMAKTLGEAVGATIGLRARLDVKVSKTTRIEVVTEGVFARMILDDPALEGIACVIFDEFHERSLDADLGLALTLDAQSGLREDLRILVMSATLDGARVASLLGENAPVITSEGRMFDVATRYLGRDTRQHLEPQMASAIRRALSEETGSILAFLPGQAEIRRTEELLRASIADPAVDIAPLYGAMDRRAQDLAIEPAAHGRRKAVLATSIAETSLTIEGVRVVIDSGLARVPRHEPGLGLTRLETVRVSRAAADQRRGRAGRTEPGICYRLWDEPQTLGLAPFTEPEIKAADLAGLTLDLASWGVTDPASLRWLDAPPAAAVTEAVAMLQAIGALTPQGRITEEGQRIRALPLPPRIARMVLAAAQNSPASLRDAAYVAALLVERGLGGSSTDVGERLARFRNERGGRADDMRKLADGWIAAAGKGHIPGTNLLDVANILALAYPDRIAKARGNTGQFLLVNGRAGMVPPEDALARAHGLVVAEMTGSQATARITLAARLDQAGFEALAAPLIEQADELTFDAAALALRARRVRRMGAITLSADTMPVPANAEAATVLAQGLAAAGLHRLTWPKSLSQWQDRVLFLRRAHSDDADNPWPDLSDATLSSTAQTWLAPHLIGLSATSQISADTLRNALESLVQWPLPRKLDEEAPTHFIAPTGSSIALDYEAEGGPVLAVRVQELYGLSIHPSLANGRVPLTLHLLSPAHRPIQITKDLPGFWRGSWAAVRTDMKGRYPRHLWPEDPARATPTARAKPRGT